MRHKIIFFLAVGTLTFLNACKRSDSENLISKSKMTEILIDQHVLEAKVLMLKLKSDSATKVYNSLEKELLESHGVNKKMFEKSFGYYMARPELLDKIYEVVVDSLNVYDQNATLAEEEYEKALAAEKERKKAEADSIAKALSDTLTTAARDSLILLLQTDSLGLLNGDSLYQLLSRDSLLKASHMDTTKTVSEQPAKTKAKTNSAKIGDLKKRAALDKKLQPKN
ncbi:DUF4296 domain-containing protein [Reichenbachiella agarivorans]|uniref:DUF4296 domain-containing protein n=1 Tax=Reichenbachiella agarivorans TaxID=2979464 RepID=A0ABY6CNW7_9BACT|nr:DUF4296 domain-containing protein [Reichenbachiella agarivorans]UXP31048.1 DUF4296 domain-containing protein [Reichenbachiella agarivorans]